MNLRSTVIFISTVLCGAALCGLVAQGRQLAALRDEQKRLATANSTPDPNATEPVASPPQTAEVPSELLQLRAEVARLSQQKRELEGARSENETLRLQLENRRTNSAGANLIPSGFIRTVQAKWSGYYTPEDTLQSLIWAVKNHNLEKFLEAATSEASEEFRKQLSQSDNPATAAEEFFKTKEFPPLQIIGKEQIADDTIAMKIQLAMPDAGSESHVSVDTSEELQFKRIGGQWKLSKTH